MFKSSGDLQKVVHPNPQTETAILLENNNLPFKMYELYEILFHVSPIRCAACVAKGVTYYVKIPGFRDLIKTRKITRRLTLRY